MFHMIKGRNITLDRSRNMAAWTPLQSCGLTFTERPLDLNEPVTLTIEGTGAIELGVTSVDPATLSDRLPDMASQLPDYGFLNDVKIHKRACIMKIELDEFSKEVVSSYGGGQYKHAISLDRKYFLVTEVKYGAVEMRLENPGDENRAQQFSEVCGRNIKRLNNPSITTSLTKSPSSLCFYAEPLTSDLNLHIHCTPKAYQSTIPGRFYLLIRYTTVNPQDFAHECPSILDMSREPGNLDIPWSQVEKLEKEECTGSPISLTFLGDSIEIVTATGKRKRTQCRTGSTAKIWLVFELYGVSVRLEQCNTLTRTMSDISEEPHGNYAEPVYSTVQPGTLADRGTDTRPTARSMRQCEDAVNLSRAIQINFTKLKDNLKIDELMDYMYEANMVTTNEYSDISDLDRHDKSRAVRKVLIEILSKRSVSKKLFIRALEKTLQDFLIPLFFIEEDKN